jgi:hypothetical protein
MPAATVNETQSILFQELQGFRTVQVFNGGPNGLFVNVDPSPNGTVTNTTGVPIGANTTAYVDVHRAYMYAISNGTANVRYT